MTTDVVISWYATNQGVRDALALLTNPVKLIEMPAGTDAMGKKINYKEQIAALGQRPIHAILQKFMPGVEPGRVCLLGFSEGCQGVREALGSPDGGRVDAAFAIDGIHTQWADQKKRLMDIALLRPWRAFASLAVADGRLCVISTSDVKPDYVDTTTTSTWIWNEATGTTDATWDEDLPYFLMGPVEPPYKNPAGTFGNGVSWKETTYTQYPLRLYRKRNGLLVVNYSDLDPTGVGDHRFQAARVSPMLLRGYLLPRWNDQPRAQQIFFNEGAPGPRPLALGPAGTAPAPALPAFSGGDQTTGENYPRPGETSADEPKGGPSPVQSVLIGAALGALGAAAVRLLTTPPPNQLPSSRDPALP